MRHGHDLVAGELEFVEIPVDLTRLEFGLMDESVSYLRPPGSTERLVVLTEEYYLSLLNHSNGRPRPFDRSALSGVPEEVLETIRDGGNPLTVVRKWRKLSGRQLARMLNISPSMISQMERHWKFGSTKTIKQIADVLDIPIELMFEAANRDDFPSRRAR